MKNSYFLLLVSVSFIIGCNKPAKLPVYGSKAAIAKVSNYTIDYTIPDFSFTDQDGNTIDSSVVKNKIFITEFFFTSCPSICPKMQGQMLRVYEKYKSNPDILILGFSIDPTRDSVGRLNSYARKLDIKSDKWHFLTGNKDSIFSLAESFLVSAAEDPDALGGHVHSGNFILVDKHKRIRGYYDGTSEESVGKLLKEIDILQQEEEDATLSNI